jgi:hypothetical protein
MERKYTMEPTVKTTNATVSVGTNEQTATETIVSTGFTEPTATEICETTDPTCAEEVRGTIRRRHPILAELQIEWKALICKDYNNVSGSIVARWSTEATTDEEVQEVYQASMAQLGQMVKPYKKNLMAAFRKQLSEVDKING